MKKLKGTGTALVTPFENDGSIDFKSLRSFVDFQINTGVDFLVVQGTTGESPTLTEDEKRQVLETVLEANKGRLPIVYGVGGNDTKKVCMQLSMVPDGVDAILSVSPYYNKPIQEGIYQHFKALSDSTDLPIILYNVPGRTGANMQSETILRLSEIKNIVAVKEASGNMDQIMEILRCKTENFSVLSGDDALAVPLIYLGADGVISVVSNALPEKFCKMIKSALDNDFSTANQLHYELLLITRYFFEQGNPGGVKHALSVRNLMKEKMRLPLFKINNSLAEKIEQELKKIL